MIFTSVAALYFLASFIAGSFPNCCILMIINLCFLVSPERIGHMYGIESRELVCASGMRHSWRQTEMPLPSFTQQLRTGKSTVVKYLASHKYRLHYFHKPFSWSKIPTVQNHCLTLHLCYLRRLRSFCLLYL